MLVLRICSGGIQCWCAGSDDGLEYAGHPGEHDVGGLVLFLVTREAPIHEGIKQKVVEMDENQTRLIFRTYKNTARVYRNSVADEVAAIEAAGGDFGQVHHLVSGANQEKAWSTGDIEAALALQEEGVSNIVLGTHAQLWRYEILRKNYARNQRGLRRDLDDWLPELKSVPRDTRESIDAIASFEMWHRPRYHQGMSKKASINIIKCLLKNLIADDRVGN